MVDHTDFRWPLATGILNHPKSTSRAHPFIKHLVLDGFWTLRHALGEEGLVQELERETGVVRHLAEMEMTCNPMEMLGARLTKEFPCTEQMLTSAADTTPMSVYMHCVGDWYSNVSIAVVRWNDWE